MQFLLDLILDYSCCQNLVARPLREDELWSSWSPPSSLFAASASSRRMRWMPIAPRIP